MGCTWLFCVVKSHGRLGSAEKSEHDTEVMGNSSTASLEMALAAVHSSKAKLRDVLTYGRFGWVGGA